ncbi:MAG: tRNA (guanosine(37)-N1)-methyltransferase TrmD [Spirochaetia bacterium]|nr:tRNA (guanosine(37)-N1)-methyltransferase TrmD [Spirochaetia bacterium]
MNINIITIYPNYFVSALNSGLLKKAIEKNIINISVINLRDFAVNSNGKVDDSPYGGGSGMVLMVEPIYKALKHINKKEKTYSILLSAAGEIYNQQKARFFSNLLDKGNKDNKDKFESLTIVCGNFEGVDQRVSDYLVDEEISAGKFVLSGGEPAALLLIDSLARLLPGFMGNPDSLKDESYNESNYLEYPQYTRPEIFLDMKTPDVLLSGNHENIKQWRKEKSLKKSLKRASKVSDELPKQ